MKHFNLPEHLHFCEMDGQRIFLDLAGDRYFGLPAGPDAAFTALLATGADAPANIDVEPLLRAGVIIAAPHGKPLEATRHPCPERSLLEDGPPPATFSPSDLIETAALVIMAKRAVRSKRLASLLARSSRSGKTASESAHRRNRLIGRFLAVRPFVPVTPNCLHDSLALRRFLERRQIAPDLVIGAKLHPFAAHCWLQQGTIVLNDSLASACGFMPVLVA
jgi:hypothetical protein